MTRIPDRVRQLVINWPSDASNGEVEEFCRRHDVSRAWFYALRKRVTEEGEAALIKRSTRPLSSPMAVPPVTVAAVIATRATLVREGKDYGPLSILDVLERSSYVPVPARSTIARILDREHLVTRNQRKRPKRSHAKIRSEYPNQRWQSDGLEVTLATGEIVVVIEIIDDCTRFNLMLYPGPSETSEVVMNAFRLAIEQYGRPVLVHTDNGTAFNMARRGMATALQRFLGDMGVKMITGRPSHPKSQGKVERAHQTLLSFIGARQPATTEELRTVLDEYRDWYNYHRSHQALPPRTTPADLYETEPKVAPPGDPIVPSVSRPSAKPRGPIAKKSGYNADVQTRKVNINGVFRYVTHRFGLGKAWRGQQITIVRHEDRLELFDARGNAIITTAWPPAKTHVTLSKQIANQQPPDGVSTMS